MWRPGLAVALTTTLVVTGAYVLVLDYSIPTAATTGVGAGVGAMLSYALVAWIRGRTSPESE